MRCRTCGFPIYQNTRYGYAHLANGVSGRVPIYAEDGRPIHGHVAEPAPRQPTNAAEEESLRERMDLTHKPAEY